MKDLECNQLRVRVPWMINGTVVIALILVTVVQFYRTSVKEAAELADIMEEIEMEDVESGVDPDEWKERKHEQPSPLHDTSIQDIVRHNQSTTEIIH